MDAVPLTYCQKFVYDVVRNLGLGSLIADCVRITGPVEPRAFERAAERLTALHPVLGSRLEMSGGEPAQRQGYPAASVEFVDATGACQREVDRVLSERAYAPLDPFRQSPLRVVMVRAGARESFLALAVHHIFADEGALQALLEEYLSLALGNPEGTAAAASDDGDRGFLSYALAERKMIGDGAFRRQARYWADKYAHADPVLHVPGRGADPERQTLAATGFRIEGDSLHAFHDRARRLRVSPFVIAATAIFHALREVTGQDDILLTVVGDSRRPPFARTIGQFAAFHIISQAAEDGGLGDGAVRAVFEEVIQAMGNYVHHYACGNDIGWLGDRIEKGFTSTDAFVNFLPAGAGSGQGITFPEHIISHHDLEASPPPSSVPYYGMVVGIGLRPEPGALSGMVHYESAIVKTEVAAMIADLIQRGLVSKS